MKPTRLVIISVLMITAFSLAGCFQPLLPTPDPDPVVPVLTVPVAAFSYYCTPPIQTNSWVVFDGRDSYDPDDEIMWGKWDFDDGTIEEGIWMDTVKEWENGEWIWVQYPVTAGTIHNFAIAGLYTVMLTVRDYDGNEDSTTRNITVE